MSKMTNWASRKDFGRICESKKNHLSNLHPIVRFQSVALIRMSNISDLSSHQRSISALDAKFGQILSKLAKRTRSSCSASTSNLSGSSFRIKRIIPLLLGFGLKPHQSAFLEAKTQLEPLCETKNLNSLVELQGISRLRCATDEANHCRNP